jgi:outer membrane murein-binding lipoprotein Lpp
MTKLEWLTVLTCAAVCLCVATLAITSHYRAELNAVAGSVDVLRGEVVRLQMEVDTLRHVRVELTVLDKTMRVVDVAEVAK